MANHVLDGAMYKAMVKGGASCLLQNASVVNDLNVFPIPDGDTGDNMRMTVEGGVVSSDLADTSKVGEMARIVADGMLLSARGNSGVILSQFFGGIAEGLEGVSAADAKTLGEAFRSGVKKAYAAVFEPTEGTILTVAREATEYAVARVKEKDSIEHFLRDFLEEMNRSLSRTPEILPVLKEAGVIDSGGAGLLYVMEGMNKILRGEDAGVADAPVAERTPRLDLSKFNENSVMEFGYCTEFLLQLQTAKVDIPSFDMKKITDFLSEIGNSVVAIKNGSIVKVHVHTMTPGKVFDYCQAFGEFLTLKVENMSLQHSESHVENRFTPKAPPKQHKKYAFVAVASGAGIQDAFYSLGADAVIEGGQTSNPSTEDFIQAFRTIDADHIIVFPNNGNVILTAKTAQDLYTDAAVHVVETHSVGEGYAALSMANLDLDSTDAVLENLNEAKEGVLTAEITHAVRDTTLNGLTIHTGDYIGIADKQILSAEKTRIDAVKAMLSALHTDGKEVCIIICGKDPSKEEMDKVRAYFKANYKNLELYEIDGQQEVYDFIFVLE